MGGKNSKSKEKASKPEDSKAKEQMKKDKQEPAKEVKETPKEDNKKGKDGPKLENQVGGHAGAFVKLSDRIMKNVSKNEYQFYTEFLPKIPELKPYAPIFYGTEARDGKNYVILEDLTKPYTKPCILDVKMGITSVGEDASPEKKEAMKKKDMGTTTHSIGIRITAMKVYQTASGQYESFGKPWGKAVTDATMVESLQKFFHNGTHLRRDLIAKFMEKLIPIQKFIESQSVYRYYSSSLLFLYDGDESGSKEVDIRLIDFAHVHEIKDGGKDEGYIFGMKNLITHLQKI